MCCLARVVMSHATLSRQAKSATAIEAARSSSTTRTCTLPRGLASSQYNVRHIIAGSNICICLFDIDCDCACALRGTLVPTMNFYRRIHVPATLESHKVESLLRGEGPPAVLRQAARIAYKRTELTCYTDAGGSSAASCGRRGHRCKK